MAMMFKFMLAFAAIVAGGVYLMPAGSGPVAAVFGPPPNQDWTVFCQSNGQTCLVSATATRNGQRISVAVGTNYYGHRTARIAAANMLQPKADNGDRLASVMITAVRLDDGPAYGVTCEGYRQNVAMMSCQIDSGALGSFVESLQRTRRITVTAANDAEVTIDARNFAAAWQQVERRVIDGR